MSGPEIVRKCRRRRSGGLELTGGGGAGGWSCGSGVCAG